MSQGRRSEERGHSSERRSKKRDRSPEEAEDHNSQRTIKIPKLNLNDLGAGYNQEDKKVAKAIKNYEELLVPFVMENDKLFSRSGFMSIKGYGTNIKDGNFQSQRSESVDYNDEYRDRSRFYNKRPRYST